MRSSLGGASGSTAVKASSTSGSQGLAARMRAERFEHLESGNRKAPSAETGAFAKDSGLGGDGEKRFLHQIIHPITITHQRREHSSQRNEVLHEELLDERDFGRLGSWIVVLIRR